MLQYFLLAIAPGAALIWYIVVRDKYDREPISLLVRCFFFGLLSIIPAIILETIGSQFGLEENASLSAIAIFSFIIIAGSEEWSKYIFLRWGAYHKPAFDEPFDGIVYSVMVSMGFATGENLMYVFSSDSPLQTAIMRMVTAVPAHYTFAVMMGYFVGMSKFKPERKWSLILMGLGSAIFFHGAYDFFLLQQSYPEIAGGAFVSLVVAILLSRKAVKIHSEHSKQQSILNGITPTFQDDNKNFTTEA